MLEPILDPSSKPNDQESSNEKLIHQPPSPVPTNEISKIQLIPQNCFITLFNSTCCPCCCNKDNITTCEYNKFQSLKNIVTVQFSQSNNDHEQLLTQFFNICSEIASSTNPQIYNEHKNANNLWQFFGYQTENPRTDFRGGGIYSLKFMIYYLENKKKLGENNKIFSMFENEYFLFAVICIRISFLVRLKFMLINGNLDNQYTVNKISRCNRHQIKVFCKCIAENDDFFMELMVVIMDLVYEKFMNKYAPNLKEKNFTIVEPITLEVINQILGPCIEIGDNCESVLKELRKYYKGNVKQNF